jgi:predicted nucleic acid-binding protein
MVIFDTSLLIDALRGEKVAIDVIKSYKDKEEAAITIINKYELMKGKKFLDDNVIDLFISSLKIYYLGEEEAAEAVTIHKELTKQGKMINELDIFIAGTAIANNELLVAMDRDFGNIKGLKSRII